MKWTKHKEIYSAEIMPGPLDKITDPKKNNSNHNPCIKRYISLSMGDANENRKKAREWGAMYCPECHEWNGEPGEYPGYCTYCDAELSVLE